MVRRRFLICIAAALLGGAAAFAETQRERGERFIRDQEQRWNVSCKAVHPRAHRFVEQHIPGVLATRLLHQKVREELEELSGATLKCFGIEPIGKHTGVAFPSDFGELHEVLRTAHEFIESVVRGKPPIVQEHFHRELGKRYEELKSGTGRRYPERV